MQASREFHECNDKLKVIGDRQKEISELQREIGNYGRTREVYAAYKRSGYDRAFYDANVADILIHRAAKKYFNAQGFEGKLPSINSLKQEWATLNTERKNLYGNYKELRNKHAALGTAKANAENILDIGKSEAQIVAERVRSRSYAYER